MKSVLATALIALFTSAPAMAFELYHCSISPANDGYFNDIDLKVDGDKITASATVAGSESGDVFAYTYTPDSGIEHIAVGWQDGRERTETVSFILKGVVGKLGSAERYTAKEGFGELDWIVEMTCDMATPL